MSEAAEDGGLGRGGEAGSSLWWWFSMNRESGGPAYHPHQHMACPFFAWYFNITISVLVFIFPLVACLVILPSVRSRNWSSLMAVFLCLVTGFLLTVVYGSSSWLVGEAAVNASVGPLKPPAPGTLGVWAGLWHVNLTYETGAFSLNERIDWISRNDLVEAHKRALSEGWPYALVSLTAELGGEGTAWQGKLGDGIMLAGLASSSLLIAAMAVWGVWVLLFTVSPLLTAPPLMLSGTITAFCSLVYVSFVNARVPHTLMVAGTKMELHLGFAWWVTAALGLCLTFVGLGLVFYDMYRPGHLATVFELDFGSPSHRLSHFSWNCPEPILAFKEEETYSQGYPWPRLPGYFLDAYVLTDDENAAKEKATMKSSHHVCKGKHTKGATAGTRTIPCPESGNKDEHFTEAPETPGGKNLVPTLSVSTLEQGQTHTPLTPTPATLRRRSPEQPQEQERPPSPQPQSEHQLATPPHTGVTETPLLAITNSLCDNHSTILVEKHCPKINASLRTHLMRKSTRSLKFFPRLPIRLSYKSPLKRKSRSMSRVMLHSESSLESDIEANRKNQKQECEGYEDAELKSSRESVTSL